jgi:hypothetical protein
MLVPTQVGLGLTVPRGPVMVEVAVSDINEDSCDGTEIPSKDLGQRLSQSKWLALLGISSEVCKWMSSSNS